MDKLGKTSFDDESLPILKVLDCTGYELAVTALKTIEGHDAEIRLLGCAMVKNSLSVFENEYPDDKRLRQALETAERHLFGKATDVELATACDAAEAAFKEAANDTDQDAYGNEFESDAAKVAKDVYLAVACPLQDANTVTPCLYRNAIDRARGRARENPFDDDDERRYLCEVNWSIAPEFDALCCLKGKYGEVSRLHQEKEKSEIQEPRKEPSPDASQVFPRISKTASQASQPAADYPKLPQDQVKPDTAKAPAADQGMKR
jgi:hypothetical protein